VAIREQTRDDVRNLGGLLSPAIVNGGYYIATCVGGWADSTTGAKWPGPRAVVNDLTREVEKIIDPPEPQQMFTHKRIRNPKDMAETIEVEFDVWDEAATTDGIQRAIDVGILRHVPDAEVERYYPQAWAKRREMYVYDPRERNKPQRALLDLLDAARTEAHAMIDAARERDKAAHAEGTQAAQK